METMNLFGLVGGLKIIILIFLDVPNLGKIQTVGRMYLADLSLIWIFTWNLMTDGLTEVIW